MQFDFWTCYWAFVAFVFGAVTGSFLNVCVWRLPRNESLSDPPSHCPNCNHRLQFFPDMVPLLSQLWYRSRCRYCGQRFSWRYFWVEVFTAVVFTALYVRFVPYGPDLFLEVERNWCAFAAMIFAAALITIFFIDLEHYQIPDIAVIVALVAAVALDGYLIFRHHRPLFQEIPGTPWTFPLPLSVMGALLALWFLWQFAALTTAILGREAMGAGDSLLLAAMASFLIPWPLVIIAFIVAVALGTVGGVAGMWLHQKSEEAKPVAEGPLAGEADPAAPAPEHATGIEPISADLAVHAAAVGESPESPATEAGTAEQFAGHRGAVDGPAPVDEEPSAPELPESSRWGRVWTVAGSWVAVGGLWGAAVIAVNNLPLGIGAGVAFLVVAAVLLKYGLAQWNQGDREWAPAMDQFFEGDPGPRFIPFGPYLVIGTFVAIFFGRAIVTWYAVGQLGMSPQDVARLPWN